MATGGQSAYLIPEFTGPFKAWATSYAYKNVWRYKSMYEVDDLIQEAALKFCICAQRYKVKADEPQHFMALFKTSVIRHFHSLARGSRKALISRNWSRTRSSMLVCVTV